MGTFYKGGNLSKEDICHNGNISCILYGELYTRYLNKIENVQSKTHYKENLVFSQKGDVILPLSGETPLDISNSAVIPSDRIALGSDLLALRTTLNPLFLSYEISGKRKKQIAKLAQGKTIVHSNPKSIMNLEIFYPSKEEQNEIINILDTLSRKIDIISNKLNALKKYKKGLQQRLFLRQNSLEYLRLKEIVKFMPKSKLSAGLSISNGKYPFFLSGDKTGKINDFLYEGIYVIANDGGEAGFRTTQNKFAYSDHCICFKAQTDYVTKNVYEYLDLIKAQITYIGFTGSGLKNIDRNYFENIKIPKIVLQPIHAFNLFNSLIERLNLKLTNLKLMKKYLLRNLFI